MRRRRRFPALRSGRVVTAANGRRTRRRAKRHCNARPTRRATISHTVKRDGRETPGHPPHARVLRAEVPRMSAARHQNSRHGEAGVICDGTLPNPRLQP
jgi:hypothetical protein